MISLQPHQTFPFISISLSTPSSPSIIMFVNSGNESESSTATIITTSSTVEWSQPCRHFEFHEIVSATANFDETLVIGRGGFGKVYKGYFKNGETTILTAIKRLDAMSDQGPSEFWAELEMLSRLRHCHLVSLVGFCNYKTEMILVYEYMSRGTLDDHLHKLRTPLSWCQRLKICIGAARGLDYLHTGTGIEFGIIHRDVKSSNILLDESWAAKVSDFGLSKISPRNQPLTHVSTLLKGTFGYIDPNYYATGKLTRKSDVYAFGVVLLEVLCGKRAVDGSLDWGLATWAQDFIKEGRVKDIIDSNIRDEISTKCLKGFARIAERCLDNHPKYRPTMTEVILALEALLTLQEKTNNLLQTASKTIFGRIVDKFSFTNNGQSTGMDTGSPIPKARNQLMLREIFLQQKRGYELSKSGVGSIRFFQLDEIKTATTNFAENMIIGRGRSGIVYKGILPDESVAIKRSKIYDEVQVEQFIKEITFLEQANHRNIVELRGCCLESKVPLLVYEFLSRGSLYEHIHNNTNARSFLFDSRIRMARESAGALAYLHSLSIIHRDVKSSNILLDGNYTTKVTDFSTKSIQLGDDQTSTIVQGTLGYLDPEYLRTGQLTEKSDVYSFGVVLAELLTGLKPFDHERCQEDKNLATYFVQSKSENQIHEIVDIQVLEEATDEQLEAACSLACRCLGKRGENRPTMKEVAMELERIVMFPGFKVKD